MASHATQRKRAGRTVGGALSARLSGIPIGGDREVPTEFRIFKAGENPSEKGTFIFDEKAALSVMEQYVALGKPMLLDFNHGTTFDTPTPEQAIAAGEFTPEVRNGELWARDVKWSDRAKAFLSAGEYRLFSPFFTHDKDKHVERLVNVALTNLPALNGIEPLVAANANTDDEESPMECTACSAKDAKLNAMDEECKALRAKLGLFEKKDEEDKTKATALKMEFVKLTGEESTPAALGAFAAMKTKADGYDKLAAEKAEMETTALRSEMTSVLEAGSKDGKVNAPIRESLEKAVLAMGAGKVSKDGIAWLSAHVKSLPKLVPTKDDEHRETASTALTAEVKDMARMAGVKPESIIAAQKQIEERRAQQAAAGR